MRKFLPRLDDFIGSADPTVMDAVEDEAVAGPKPIVVQSGPVNQQASMPEEDPEVAAILGADEEMESSPYSSPSKTKLAIAQSLIENGRRTHPQGAGWVGALDNVFSSGAGAYLAKDAEREQLEYQKRQGEILSNALGGDGGQEDAFMRYIKAMAQTDPARAQAMLEKKMIADAAANRAAANKAPLNRERNVDGVTIQETSTDNGKTWTEFGRRPTYKPDDSVENINDETIDFMAEQYLEGDKTAFLRLPQKQTVRLRNAIAAKAKALNLSPSEVNSRLAEFSALTKGLGSLSTRQANIDTAAAEADGMANLALEASKSIPRGKFVPLNVLQQNVELAYSNPQLAKFKLYATAVATAMATVAGRGTTNAGLQQEFLHMLGTAKSHEAFAAQMQAVKEEAYAVMNSTQGVRGHMVDEYTGRGAKGGGGHSPAAPPEEKTITDPNDPTGKKKIRVRKTAKGWEEI